MQTRIRATLFAAVLVALLLGRAGAAALQKGEGTDAGLVLAAPGLLVRDDPVDKIREGCHAKVYRLHLQAGHLYRIDLESPPEPKEKWFDTFLRIEDDAGQKLGENDDGGEGRNSRLHFAPPRTGIYRLVVLSCFQGGTGAYQLTVRRGGVIVHGQLAANDPKDRNRTNSHHKLHLVPLLQGRKYTIDLESTDFDAYLRLEDPGGKELATNDDGGDGFNARLTFTPDRSGTYRIIATTFRDGQVGRYILKVSE